jgi:cathepsin A (carboxypeptidase C)
VFFEAFQKYKHLDFHITGESYAGHYIPAIAKVIVEKNAFASPAEKINLVSVAIGNGITDALTQNEFFPDMAADTKYGPILQPYEIERMRKQYPLCRTISKACYRWQSPITCVPAEAYCAKVAFDAFEQTGLNYYDIRLKPGDKKFDTYSNAIDSWLNRQEIQKTLGVEFPHQGCSDKVMDNFVKQGDEMYPIVNYIPPLLESGLRVLIYAGDADWICNWIGNKGWVLKLDWPGKQGFNRAKDIPWVSKKSGKPAGEFRQYENFAFLRVYESSHFVPFDQPVHSNEFINAWIRNKAIVE